MTVVGHAQRPAAMLTLGVGNLGPELPASNAHAPALELERMNAAHVEMTAGGRLRPITALPGHDPQVAAAVLLADSQRSDPSNPFAELSGDAGKRTLAAFLRNNAALVCRLVERQAMDREANAIRASLLSLALCAHERRVQIDSGQREVSASALLELVLTEPDSQVRRFYLYQMTRSPQLEGTVAALRAHDIVFPPAPPYDEWRQDGVLRIKLYIDDDGMKAKVLHDKLTPSKVDEDSSLDNDAHADGGYAFELPEDDGRMELVEGDWRDPTSTLVYRLHNDEAGDGEAHTFEIVVPPRAGAETELFESVDEEGIDAIFYAGHAGFGRRVRNSLAGSGTATGHGQLIALLQCSGDSNVRDVQRQFPDAQVLSTHGVLKWPEDELASLLFGLWDGDNWDAILSTIGGGSNRYFAPSSASTLERFFDFDRDGTPVASDRLYAVPHQIRFARSATGFNPLAHDHPAYRLSGIGLQRCVDSQLLTFGYNTWKLSPDLDGGGAIELYREIVQEDGFFEPAANDLSAFQFRLDRSVDPPVLRARLSTRFAHTAPEDLKGFMAFELGRTLALASAKTEAEATAYGLALYARELARYGARQNDAAALDNEDVEHRLFLARYGLPPIPRRELLDALPGKPGNFEGDAIDAWVERFAGRLEQVVPTPRTLGTKFDLPTPLRLESSDFGPSYARLPVERLLHSIGGLDGHRVLALAPSELDALGNLIVVEAPDGARRVLVADFDHHSGRLFGLRQLDVLDAREVALAGLGSPELGDELRASAFLPAVTGELARLGSLPRALESVIEEQHLSQEEREALDGWLAHHFVTLQRVFSKQELEATLAVLY